MHQRRSAMAAALVVAASWIAGYWLETALLSGWSIDQSLRLRHLFIGDRHLLSQSPTVVVAIDEDTFDHPGFRDSPMALWGPQFARALNAIDQAGARIIGLDVIPSTTAEMVAPGHDRPLIAAFGKLGSSGRLVLARADFSDRSIAPHPIFAFVAGGANIRSVNIPLDRDGIARRIPLWLESQSGPVSTFVAEIAGRAGAELGRPDPRGARLVNFSDRAIAPSYSLGDIATCIDADARDDLAKAFAGRIVLLGATLDIEDRKSVSGRGFVDGSLGRQRLQCAGAAPARQPNARTTLPGVFILAQAINDRLLGEELALVPDWQAAAILLALAAIGSALGWRQGAVTGALTIAVLVAAWCALAGLGAIGDRILPMAGGAVTMVAGFSGVFGLRALVIEREKRRLAHALSRYLDEKVALELLSGESAIQLGGESRDITVWFSDIAGFSTIAEGVAPRELVRRLNLHFNILGEAIESEGGIIDKFVGDAVVAIFGAPIPQQDHAARALRAAQKAMRRMLSDPVAAGEFRVRIGINTGPALVGNVGSNRRFDYTAIGDTVNIAQRLEAASKEHGTSILVSAATASAAGPSFHLRPVGAIGVKGRAGKIEAMELLLD